MRSANNLCYWACNELEPEEIRILGDLPRQPRERDRFWTAHLIAMECLELDDDGETVSITEKGIDGLDLFQEHPND